MMTFPLRKLPGLIQIIKKYQSSLPQIQLNFGTIHNGSWSEDIANKQTHLILFEEPKQRWKWDERFGKSSLKHS